MSSSRYVSEPITEEAAAHLRAQVPDNPVPLPGGRLACEGCGVATSSPPVVWTEAMFNPRTNPVPFGRCDDCQAVHAAADAYVGEHPMLGRRVGDVIARERIETVLFGLEVIARPAPDDLGLVLPRMFPAAARVRFRDPISLTKDLCSRYRWAHVTTSQRAGLRTAYAAVLADQLAITRPPVPIGCPSLACALCGVGSVSRSAIEVARRGGVPATTLAVWRGVESAGLRGHVCPDCHAAIEAVGSLGPSAPRTPWWRSSPMSARARPSHLRRCSPTTTLRRCRRGLRWAHPGGRTARRGRTFAR